MNPYQVLGVRRDATQGKIKSAFREKAKKAHPDHSGDANEFLRLHAAYRILSDPKRRHKYDQTGETEDSVADNEHCRVLGMVGWAFHAALESCVKQNIDPVRVDLISLMKDALTERSNQVNQRIEQISIAVGGYRKLVGRFEHDDDGPNLVEELLAAKIVEMERSEASVKSENQTIEEALRLLSSYRFRRHVIRQIITNGTLWSGVSATTC